MKKQSFLILSFLGFLFLALISIVFVASRQMLGGASGGGDKLRSTFGGPLVLELELKGPIFDGQKFVKRLAKYDGESNIRAILIRVDSPGGAVGASEEIYQAIMEFKEKTKKPVVVYSPNILASGAYYVAAAADEIVVTKGSLVGSIGVIMEFANLERLYDWAKVNRYSITSGRFKDSGAEYRSMREDERAYFQSLVQDTYEQFKSVVRESRKNIKSDILDSHTDGRVFSGQEAVKLGFADKIGTQQTAFEAAAKLAGLVPEVTELYVPKKIRPNFFEILMGAPSDEDEWEDEDYGMLAPFLPASFKSKVQSEALAKKLLRADYLNQPLYLMPGFF